MREELLRHYEPLKGSLEQYVKSEGTDPGWGIDPSHLIDFTKEGLAEKFMVWVPK